MKRLVCLGAVVAVLLFLTPAVRAQSNQIIPGNASTIDSREWTRHERVARWRSVHCNRSGAGIYRYSNGSSGWCKGSRHRFERDAPKILLDVSRRSFDERHFQFGRSGEPAIPRADEHSFDLQRRHGNGKAAQGCEDR